MCLESNLFIVVLFVESFVGVRYCLILVNMFGDEWFVKLLYGFVGADVFEFLGIINREVWGGGEEVMWKVYI